MIQGPLRKQDWVDYPGKGELAWGFGWKKCHSWRAMDGQPSLISEKSGKDGVTYPSSSRGKVYLPSTRKALLTHMVPYFS